MVTETAGVVAQGLLLGLSTGTYCLTACAPLMVPYVMADGRTKVSGGLRIVGEFLAGRLVAYLLFAAIVGSLGQAYARQVPPHALAAAQVVCAILVIVFAVVRVGPTWSACRLLMRRIPLARTPLVLGFLMGINICPPFILALERLLALGSVALSVILFVGFFVGTAVFTLPLAFIAPLARAERARSIGALAALLAGVWFLITGAAALLR